MKDIRKNQQGFTLVEILSGLVMMTIVLASLGGIYLYAMQYVDQYASKREIKLIVDSTLDIFVEGITYATDIYVSDSNTLPDGWEEAETKSYHFEGLDGEGACGTVSTSEAGVMFDPMLYADRYLVCKLEYDNQVNQISDAPLADDELSMKNMIITFEVYDEYDELIYIRNREVELLNLTIFRSEERRVGKEC